METSLTSNCPHDLGLTSTLPGAQPAGRAPSAPCRSVCVLPREPIRGLAESDRLAGVLSLIATLRNSGFHGLLERNRDKPPGLGPDHCWIRPRQKATPRWTGDEPKIKRKTVVFRFGFWRRCRRLGGKAARCLPYRGVFYSIVGFARAILPAFRQVPTDQWMLTPTP